jgi:hypothetical protein
MIVINLPYDSTWISVEVSDIRSIREVVKYSIAYKKEWIDGNTIEYQFVDINMNRINVQIDGWDEVIIEEWIEMWDVQGMEE